MSPETALIALEIIKLILKEGVPAYIEWTNGMKLQNPTLEDIKKLMDIKKPEEF